MELLSLAAYILLVDFARAFTGPGLSLNKFGPPQVRAVDFQSDQLYKRNDLDKYNITAGTFQQLIDHSNPSLGHFTQRYWWNADHYAGDGSPIVFWTPGYASGAYFLDYTTNLTLPGLIAQAIGGAAVVFEHRYAGTSSPFTDLTAANMTYLTLENSVKDTTYFAKNVKLPFDSKSTSSPEKAPWIFSGGGYGGVVTAFTNVLDPNVFWAYHASSAPVQAITDFWQWFTPVQEGLPKNCSTDVARVVDYMDKVLTEGELAETEALKAKFGFAALAHMDDFVAALWNIPQYWQEWPEEIQRWCDYVENVWPNSTNKVPGAEGVGVEKALEGYAKYSREVFTVNYCTPWANWYNFPDWNGTGNVQCFDTYNTSTPTFSTNISVDNSRVWNYLVCDWALGYWQNGAPLGQPSLVSRLVNVSYWRRQCNLMFGPSVAGRTADDVNKVTGGWLMNTTRLVWVDGKIDPWREAGVSSSYRPGGPRVSTNDTPVFVIPGGGSTPDLYASKHAEIKKVQDAVIALFKGWVQDFHKQKGMSQQG